VAPAAPDQLTVKLDVVTADVNREIGSPGFVSVFAVEDAVVPHIFIAYTITAYAVPADREVNAAEEEVDDAGTVVAEFNVYV
jgi:hypothetical protein